MTESNLNRRDVLKKLFSLSALAASGCYTVASDLSVTGWFTYPIVEMSQVDGENKLIGLATTATEEDCWAMVPAGSTCRWYDVGFLQSSRRNYINSSAHRNFLKAECSSGFKSVVFYHIHPLIGLFDMSRTYANLLNSSNMSQEQFEMLSIPSPGDIVQHIQREEFYENNPSCTVRISKVASPHGIFTYSTSPLLAESEIEDVLYESLAVGFKFQSLQAQLEVCARNGINISYDRRKYLNQKISLD